VISEQSRLGIDFIFDRAARKALVLNPDDSCVIEKMPEDKSGDFQGRQMLVLTISSLLFRVLTIFHIDEDKTTRDYFLNKNPERSLEDFFSEIANLCSGAMNQELLKYFPHLGMSTPYWLSGQCLPYLKELNPGYLSRHAITINDSVCLHATICMCHYAPVHFEVDQKDVEDISGELEFF
jgi:hypothetical protein